MSAPAHRARKYLPRLLPYALVVAALPLLAPTCGGQAPGVKAFSKGSLIIPMDACYQNTPTPLAGTTYATPYAGCPSNGATTSDHGNVMKAYGLVYQLLRNDIPVYWVINSQKSPPSGAQPLVDTAHPDIAIDYATGGAVGPVGKYVWSNDTVGAMPANDTGSSIGYQGGPFVVDGSDAAAARIVMQSLKATFSPVNVHVSNVAFSAEVARSMSGNFSNSGGTVAPPIALLNITGGDAKNSESVILGYLVNAGLGSADFAGAGGVATPTGHGKIYDDLYPADFLPTACTTSCANGSPCSGGLCASNLVAYGYSILWVPHWCGPGSTGFPAGSTYADVLASIRAFMNAGHDVMAECASIGTFEGVNNSAACSGDAAGYPPGTPAQPTQVQTTSGMNINETGLAGGKFLPTLTSPPATGQATFATPFLQIGDFPYQPITGAIQQFSPTGAYVARPTGYQHQRLIADSTSTSKDYFTWLPAYGGQGNVVYLAGHDFSGGQSGTGAFQVAGSRLVLNTLFNLGASCKATHAACTAQALGTCAQGTRECCTAADVTAGTCQNVGDPFCKPGTPGVETCNGLDDDCDGIVDDHLTDAQATTATGCYPGATAGCTQTAPGSYACQGVCHAGTWSCSGGAWSCVGAGTPRPETCNGLDDDCNGTVDDNLTPPGGVATCYTGPTFTGTPVPGTSTGCQVSGSTIVSCQGECRSGTWACVSAAWSCSGQVLPAPERCESTLKDYNCNGIAGDGCDCVLGTVQPCPYPTYPSGSVTPGLGICRTGTQSCVANPVSGGPNVWGACTGQVLPHLDGSGTPAEICGNGIDDDCNGIVDDPAVCDCKAGDTVPCFPAGTAGCTPKPAGGSCASGTTEISGFCCAGVCAPGVRTCVAGKFSDACVSAVTPSPAEKCNGLNDTCSASWSGDGAAPCGAGQACVNGVCIIPTIPTEGSCACGYVKTGAAPPYTCDPAPCPDTAGGHVAGTACPAGQLCLMADGSCPAPGTVGTTCKDPCAGKSCGEGAYCSGGACVAGGCTATGCTGADAGKACRNGTCQVDPCAGFTCPAGTFCRGNYGESPPVADCVRPCATVVCPQGQACGADGFCAPDPCATVTCAAGQACVAGACVADPCPPGHCGLNQICVDGRCADDPCAGTGAVSCPVGTCRAGQCYDTANPNGYGPPPPATSTTKSGCGCGSAGDSGPMALVLLLLGLPLARRRRPRSFRGGGLAVLAALLVLGGSACSKTTKEKPSCETCGGDSCVDVRTSAANCGACGAACGAGQACGSGTCIAAAAVPVITAVSPVPVSGNATLTVTGTGFTTGAATRLRVSGALPQAEVAPAAGSLTSTGLQASVDLSAVGTGTLQVQVVNADRTVSNVWGVAVGTPTPAIASLAPTLGIAGTVVAGVVVTGSNFTSNAVCVQRVGTTETAIAPSTRTVPTSLTCDLDLRAALPSTTVQVMVQNENGVRSAAAAFQAVSPGPPVVTSLSPNTAPQGAEINLLVKGSAFAPNSGVEIGATTAGPWTPLPTTYVDSTALRASLSLKSYAAGTWQVHVVSPGNGASGALALVVTASAPVASNVTVTPATPVLGLAGVQLALSGSGFDSGCALEVQPPLGSFRPADSSTFTSPQLLQGTVNLTAAGDTAGTWNVRANCGGTTTAALPFTVASNQASLVSVTPAGGGQGETVAVTLTGGNFLGGMQLQLTTQGGAVEQTVTPSLTGTPPASGATASLSLAGVATGVHLLKAVNYVGATAAPASNPIAFSVTPGTPAIASVAVASAATGGACGAAGACSSWPATADACALQQPAGVQATIAGSNFGAGVTTVYVNSAITGKIDVSSVLAPGSVVVADASTIQVALDTTTVLPQVYTLTVENPGKPPSNPVPFKVTTTSCP